VNSIKVSNFNTQPPQTIHVFLAYVKLLLNGLVHIIYGPWRGVNEIRILIFPLFLSLIKAQN
jgi:hypothetical protein